MLRQRAARGEAPTFVSIRRQPSSIWGSGGLSRRQPVHLWTTDSSAAGCLVYKGCSPPKNLGGFSLSYAPGQLMVGALQGPPNLGGSYAVGACRLVSGFVLTGRGGSLLPM